MSLTTYTGLLAAIPARLTRTDLTALIPDFVTLTETAMNRRLRVRRMVARATATITDGYSAVPSDFLGVETFDIDGKRIAFLTPDQINIAESGLETGTPKYFSIVGGEFRFYPTPGASSTATITYWQSIPALSVSNASNWVLASHPDAYLYGGCLQAALHVRDADLQATYGQLFETAMSDIEAGDRAESFGALQPLPNGAYA